MKRKLLIMVFSVLALITACSSAAADKPDDVIGEVSLSVYQKKLENLSYAGIYDEPVTLIDGTFAGEPFEEGGSSRPTVSLLSEPAFGDLNNDDVDDAAVILVENSGGSGSFYYLAAVISKGDGPENIATEFIGDRISPESIQISKAGIVLSATSFAEDDPFCCPSLKIIRTYHLENDRLVLVDEKDVIEAIVDDLSGTSWLIEFLPLLEETQDYSHLFEKITLQFQDGKISGFAGCNQYFSDYQIGIGQTVGVGPVGSTRMSCGAEVDELEQKYFSALASVVGYDQRGDYLEFYDGDFNLLIRLAADVKSFVPENLLGVWYWTGYQDTAEINDFTVAEPSKYTLTILDDSTARIFADCNHATFGVEIQNSGLRFLPGPMTLAECEPASLSDDFLGKLNYAGTYVFDDYGNLIINLQMDAGNMVFSRSGAGSN